MFEAYIAKLFASPIFQIFLIGLIGYLLGSINIKGIKVGDAGVLLVALVAGHFGFSVPTFVNSLGVATFVGAVGLMAGPKFFSNFKKNAKSYVLIGLFIILSGAIITAVIKKISGIDSALAAGLMSGALTSTPGLAAAQEAAGEVRAGLVSVGYGIAYPFGVLGVVLFVQLMPKVLKRDMKQEVAKLEAANISAEKKESRKFFEADHLGMLPLCITIAFGVVLGSITIPLPGGASFSLGTSGGPLVAGLIVGHFGHMGPLSMKTKKSTLEVMRELGLILFLISAGVKGGAGFVEILKENGAILFLYGVLITLIPMIIGYVFAEHVLKLPLLNSLGSICGGMTSTPALGTLISTAGTDDVATPYASTYPIALVVVVLAQQFLVLFI